MEPGINTSHHRHCLDHLHPHPIGPPTSERRDSNPNERHMNAIGIHCPAPLMLYPPCWTTHASAPVFRHRPAGRRTCRTVAACVLSAMVRNVSSTSRKKSRSVGVLPIVTALRRFRLIAAAAVA